jgi:hypothetical protein
MPIRTPRRYKSRLNGWFHLSNDNPNTPSDRSFEDATMQIPAREINFQLSGVVSLARRFAENGLPGSV